MKYLLTLLLSALTAICATTNFTRSVMANSSGVIVAPANFMAANGIVSNGVTATVTNGLATTGFVNTAVAPLVSTNSPNGKTISINGRLDFGSTGGFRFPTNADQLVTYGPYLTIGAIDFPESSSIPWEIAVYDGPNDESYHFAYREHLVDIRDNLTNQVSQNFLANSNFAYTAISERCFVSNNIPYYATYSGGTYTSGILEEGSLYYYKPGTGTGEGGSITETPSGQSVNPNSFFVSAGKAMLLSGNGTDPVNAQLLKYPLMYGGTNYTEITKVLNFASSVSNFVAGVSNTVSGLATNLWNARTNAPTGTNYPVMWHSITNGGTNYYIPLYK